MFSAHKLAMLRAKLRRILVVTLALVGYLTGTLGYPILQSPARTEVAAPSLAKSKSTIKPKRCCHCPQGSCSVNCCCKPVSEKPEPNPEKPNPQKSKPQESSTSVTWVLGMSARSCRGESTKWTLVPIAPPPDAWLTWEYRWVFVQWVTPGQFDSSVRSTPPPSPPPRSC